jgi:hypothetical protein
MLILSHMKSFEREPHSSYRDLQRSSSNGRTSHGTNWMFSRSTAVGRESVSRWREQAGLQLGRFRRTNASRLGGVS